MNKILKKLLLGVVVSTSLLGIKDVSAETMNLTNGTGNETINVTVGSVDTPVYSVTLIWEDLSFDWKFDETTQKYAWKHTDKCSSLNDFTYTTGADAPITPVDSSKLFYTSTDCTGTGLKFANLISGATYRSFTSPTFGEIEISDNSTNARIKSTVTFTPNANYNWVEGKFYDSSCDQDNRSELQNSTISINKLGQTNIYAGWAYLDLSIANTNHNAPVAGDVIGTVTINVSPNI